MHLVNVSKQSARILHMETPGLVTVSYRPLETFNKIAVMPAGKNLDNSNVNLFAKDENFTQEKPVLTKDFKPVVPANVTQNNCDN